MHRSPSTPHSFHARIEEQKKLLQEEIARTEAGPARNELTRKLRQLDVASHVDTWLSSPGLQSSR